MLSVIIPNVVAPLMVLNGVKYANKISVLTQDEEPFFQKIPTPSRAMVIKLFTTVIVTVTHFPPSVIFDIKAVAYGHKHNGKKP